MKAAYLFLKKHGVSISFIIGTILSVISIGAIYAGKSEGTTLDDLYKSSIFNPALIITFILILLTSLAAIVGPTIYTVRYFKESFKTLILFVGVIVLYFLSLAIGSTPTTEDLVFLKGANEQPITCEFLSFLFFFRSPNENEIVKYIDGLFVFTIFIFFLTMCSLVFMGVWGFIKQR